MPTITIDGKVCEFTPGEMILQVALRNGVAIPYYCYHPGLSIVASCRICLAEVWAPNPRNNNALEPLPKLVPTCQTAAGDGQVVYSNSPKAVQNQKAVMEYLLINHPLDCPVCDQAGECLLQDYSYEYGRSVSRFEEDKIKQPKKDIGPNVLLYSDRCIMCSRCVRFTREVTGTAELTIEGRGAHEQIDVFPGKALDNPLAGNVVDLCPVGALLDKDFLFAQRVWRLNATPSIDGITSSGDNIWVEHYEGKVYRIKPRENLGVNRWWITDEVRQGFHHVHAEQRLRTPMRRQFGALVESDYTRAYADVVEQAKHGRVLLIVSPLVACEEAYTLADAALALDGQATLAVGPVPKHGEDCVYPPEATPAHEGGTGFVVRAEKAPNARGVRRVLEALGGKPALTFNDAMERARRGEFATVILVGGYPSEWATADVTKAFDGGNPPFLVLIDTLGSSLVERARVVLPGATWVEKAGTFENAFGLIQAFEQAIPVIEMAKPEGQIGLDLLASAKGEKAKIYDAARLRKEMASRLPTLGVFTSEVKHPAVDAMKRASDMAVVEI
ncbi:MAG: molybdopterin-dependent oxidoreductase [Phycisphaerales bacterium]